MSIGDIIKQKEEERINDFYFNLIEDLVPQKISDYSLKKEWLYKSNNELSFSYEKEIDEFHSLLLTIRIPYGGLYKDIRVSFCYFDDGDEYEIGDPLWFSDFTEEEIQGIEKFIKLSEKKTKKFLKTNM